MTTTLHGQRGKRAAPPRKDASTPQFWRDAALPFIELRTIEDGRQLCYGRHSHEIFSIGAITHGQSTYSNRDVQLHVSAGTVVLMNPGDVHACNPIDGQGWSYLMLYVDPRWLGELQHSLEPDRGTAFRPFAPIASTDPDLYKGLLQLRETLLAPQLSAAHKTTETVAFFTMAQRLLGTADADADADADAISPRLERAARFIQQHCTRPLSLELICQTADLSPSQLIRAFKQHYGMTPHAYLLNRRIQLARTLLKRGTPLAEVALEAGFADQAHFQRAFKQLLAATPGQYRGIG